MTIDRGAMINERKLLKQKYGALFESVAALLFDADPVGINFDENTDEYEPEAITILCRLTPSCTLQDVETIVHEEFCHWFGVEDAGSIEKYKPVAASILELWLEFNQPHA